MTTFKFTATTYDDGTVITGLESSVDQYPALELTQALSAVVKHTSGVLAEAADIDPADVAEIIFRGASHIPDSSPKEN